ncbi:MAG: zinc-ribbon domain-containing protein [Deltaproteobacteria bacterium]|jgi:hypothetical protein|nr:zinc-ribbon domain-containing protein [Deltaproteobacteria bacterium]
MSFCHKCGTQNPDQNKFCLRCGQALVVNTDNQINVASQLNPTVPLGQIPPTYNADPSSPQAAPGIQYPPQAALGGQYPPQAVPGVQYPPQGAPGGQYPPQAIPPTGSIVPSPYVLPGQYAQEAKFVLPIATAVVSSLIGIIYPNISLAAGSTVVAYILVLVWAFCTSLTIILVMRKFPVHDPTVSIILALIGSAFGYYMNWVYVTAKWYEFRSIFWVFFHPNILLEYLEAFVDDDTVETVLYIIFEACVYFASVVWSARHEAKKSFAR